MAENNTRWLFDDFCSVVGTCIYNSNYIKSTATFDYYSHFYHRRAEWWISKVPFLRLNQDLATWQPITCKTQESCHKQPEKVSENAVNMYRKILGASEIITMHWEMETTRTWGWCGGCAGAQEPNCEQTPMNMERELDNSSQKWMSAHWNVHWAPFKMPKII